MTPQVPLHQAMLDDATVDQLFFDIANAATLIAVLQRAAAGRRADAATSSPEALDAARRAFAAREIAGVQLRYRFGGEEWWDTLLRTEHGVRLIRISHTRALAADLPTP